MVNYKLNRLRYLVNKNILNKESKAAFISYNHPIAFSQIYPILNIIKSKDIFSSPDDYLINNKNITEYEVVFIQVKWDFNSQFLFDFIKLVKLHNQSEIKIIFLDWYAPLHINFPNILDIVDVYVKKQVLLDLKKYNGMFDTNLVEYESRWNREFLNTKYIRVNTQSLSTKLVVGWNFATDKLRVKQLNKKLYSSQLNRSTDIHSRMCSPSERNTWYGHMRGRAYDAISLLADNNPNLVVLNQSKKIKYNKYIEELTNSKICISPFGYGEVCWRDFEAILAGALLIKPDMSHIETNPNIYQPFITYIPIRWDFQDLEEKCLYYLQNEDERLKIIQNSIDVWTSFLSYGFSETINKLSKKVSLPNLFS